MRKLVTAIEVDDDAIVRHLLEVVQRGLYGPDFSVGDVVELTADATPPADDDFEAQDALAERYGVPLNVASLDAAARAVLVEGTPGVIYALSPEPPAVYQVALVDGDGRTATVTLPAAALRHRKVDIALGDA